MPTYEEAERELLNEYNDAKKDIKMGTTETLPMDVVIHSCNKNKYPKNYFSQFMNKHFSKGEKYFYNLVQQGIIIRADDSNETEPTTIYNYDVDAIKYKNYMNVEIGKNRTYLHTTVTEQHIYDEVTANIETNFENCGAIIDEDFSKFLNQKVKDITKECNTLENKILIHCELYKHFDSQAEMQRLNGLISSADENSKNPDRTKRGEDCKKILKQIDYAMIGHKSRGFWSMVFHPVTYYREYKAIETAKTMLVEKYNLKRDFVDKYTKYLDDVIEADMKFDPKQKPKDVEIHVGEKKFVKIQGISSDFKGRQDGLDQAYESVVIKMNNIKGLVGETTWNTLSDTQKEYLESSWNELTDKIHGANDKDREIDGNVMDKLMEKYYGLTPDKQNEVDYGHKKLVIINGFLMNHGYRNIPDLQISQEESIINGKYIDPNKRDEPNLDESSLDESGIESSVDYNNLCTANAPVYEAVKLVHDEMSLQNPVKNEPDLDELENDTKLAEQNRTHVYLDESIRENDKYLDTSYSIDGDVM